MVARVRAVRSSKEVGSNALTLRRGGEREAVALLRRFLTRLPKATSSVIVSNSLKMRRLCEIREPARQIPAYY